MFSVMDVAVETVNRPKTAADRACDQCKARKVRCDSKRPCVTCASKGFECTYNQARKKRGPVGKRIQAIQRSQDRTFEGPRSILNQEPASPSSVSGDNGPDSESNLALHQTASNTSFYSAVDENDTVPLSLPWTSNPALQAANPMDSTLESNALTPMRSRTMGSMTSYSAPGVSDHVSPSMSEFIFPSLPIESPSSAWDPFGSLLEQQVSLTTPAIDIWPSSINEERLMPWYDVYFKRLHPTIPILSRTALYHDLLLRKHHTSRQYGAMVLGLCAFAMSQPVQIHERASIPSRSVQARMLMEECVKLRVVPDFGEEPCIEMVLTSFFLFACLFGNGSHKAARLRLREAVDIAYSMGIHLPHSYHQLGIEAREQWLRTYLVLSVTERAYALQQRYSIDFRGRPGMTTRFMQAFDADGTTESISEALFRDSSDAVGMVGLLYLMETFDAIDERVIDCWNGFCPLSDGICEAFDRRRALAMFRAQYKATEACINGSLWVSNVSTRSLSELMETQRADIHVTQAWLLNRLWNLCSSHNLLRISSDHPELQYSYAYQIAQTMARSCEKLTLAALEVHGIGMAEKIYDIGAGILTALKATGAAAATMSIHVSGGEYEINGNSLTVQELLQKFQQLLQDFRGGDHPYNERFLNAMNTVLVGEG